MLRSCTMSSFDEFRSVVLEKSKMFSYSEARAAILLFWLAQKPQTWWRMLRYCFLSRFVVIPSADLEKSKMFQPIRGERISCFSDRPEKHNLGRGRWDLAFFKFCWILFGGKVENVKVYTGRRMDDALWQKLTWAFGLSELKTSNWTNTNNTFLHILLNYCYTFRFLSKTSNQMRECAKWGALPHVFWRTLTNTFIPIGNKTYIRLTKMCKYLSIASRAKAKYILKQKKFSNTSQIRIFITEIHVEINKNWIRFFFLVNAITILSNTKYCKISFVWSAVPFIKNIFQKDKMSIFWTFSMCFGDGSWQFWWTLTY